MALQKSADILLKRKKAACGAARNGEIGFSGCPNSCQHRRHNLIFIIQQREQIQIFRAD